MIALEMQKVKKDGSWEKRVCAEGSPQPEEVKARRLEC